MSKFSRGWSSRRGTATHLWEPWLRVSVILALCGAPIRIFDRKEMPYKKSDPRFELCDFCQREQRRRRRKA